LASAGLSTEAKIAGIVLTRITWFSMPITWRAGGSRRQARGQHRALSGLWQPGGQFGHCAAARVERWPRRLDTGSAMRGARDDDRATALAPLRAPRAHDAARLAINQHPPYPRSSEVYLTLHWREMDSNLRFRTKSAPLSETADPSPMLERMDSDFRFLMPVTRPSNRRIASWCGDSSASRIP
jgi:hypothetical protein